MCGMRLEVSGFEAEHLILFKYILTEESFEAYVKF